MLDVITTISESTPSQWVTQCIESIDVAASLAGYQVNPILCPGVPGHIGRAMRGGLDRSRSEWVCFVDDDDYVLPDAFECLQEHFQSRPDAICAREIHLMANGAMVPQNRRHHLTAFRRDIIDTVDLTAFPAFPNVAIHVAARSHAVDEMSWVYVHRMYLSHGMHLRARAQPGERAVLLA